jgi:hypothetical protein
MVSLMDMFSEILFRDTDSHSSLSPAFDNSDHAPGYRITNIIPTLERPGCVSAFAHSEVRQIELLKHL